MTALLLAALLAPPLIARPAGTTEAGWQALIVCESGRTNANTGNGYFGYEQFDDPTWFSVTGLPGHASDYDAFTQIEAGFALYDERGAEPWPWCGRAL